MLTLGSRFKARLQVRQNISSSRFLWNFVVSSCFFLVFQEAEIHSAGLRPSISMYDLHYLHCLHLQVATATPPFRIPFPRPWPSFSTASTSFPSSFHLPILAIRNFLPQKFPFRGHGQYCSRPPPQRRPPAAVGPRRHGRVPLHSAATSSLGAPAGVTDAEGPVSCMVRCFFPSETTPK